MYGVVINGQVTSVSETNLRPFVDESTTVIELASIEVGQLWDGTTLRDNPQIVARRYESATQSMLDSKAQELGFDSILSAVSYAEEPADPDVQADAIRLRAWRSRVWKKARKIRVAVESESRTLPSVDDFLTELPQLV